MRISIIIVLFFLQITKKWNIIIKAININNKGSESNGRGPYGQTAGLLKKTEYFSVTGFFAVLVIEKIYYYEVKNA